MTFWPRGTSVNYDRYTETLCAVLMIAFVKFVPQKNVRGVSAMQQYRSHKYAHQWGYNKIWTKSVAAPTLQWQHHIITAPVFWKSASEGTITRMMWRCRMPCANKCTGRRATYRQGIHVLLQMWKKTVDKHGHYITNNMPSAMTWKFCETIICVKWKQH